MADKTSKELTEMLYEKTTTPYWTERCGHGGYLFSFKHVSMSDAQDEDLDVYCWDHVDGRQEFCLRFGDEDSHYRSPGGIESILSMAARGWEPYRSCMELLRLVGDIRLRILNPDRIPQGEPHSEERRKQLEDLKSGRIGRSRYKEDE
jgi:hypothetical protein